MVSSSFRLEKSRDPYCKLQLANTLESQLEITADGSNIRPRLGQPTPRAREEQLTVSPRACMECVVDHCCTSVRFTWETMVCRFGSFSHGSTEQPRKPIWLKEEQSSCGAICALLGVFVTSLSALRTAAWDSHF